jgi:hypothetical protein
MKTKLACVTLLVVVMVLITAGGVGGVSPGPAALPQSDLVDKYVHSLRADLSRGKVQIFNDVMKLSASESATFWPIYQDYESELFDLGDKRVELIRRFAADQRDGKLSSDEAASLASGYFDFESQRVALLKKYYDIIAKDLSPVRAAQFTQIEHRVGTVVDLMIAAEMPLIRAEGEAVPAANKQPGRD